MKKNWKFMLSILWILLLTCNISVQAADTKEREREAQQIEKSLLEEFEFDDVEQMMKEILPGAKTTFQDLMKSFVKGDMDEINKIFFRFVKDRISYEIRYNKEVIIHILLIGIIAAVFTNFSGVFTNRQVSDIGFYIIYILLITIGLNSFLVVLNSVEANISLLVSFMKVLGPVYFLAVAFSSGSVSAVAFYNIVLLLIYLIELVIVNFLLPLIHVYIMIKVLNHLSGEDYLSRMADFLETITVWLLKTMLTCVIGLNLIQGMISPAIDTVKRSVWSKGLEAIPGVGDVFGGATQVVFGTAVLIKNGIGVTGAVICILICIGPIIKIALITLMYKMVAALIQPVTDKRIVSCVGSIGDGCQLLLRVTYTSAILFLITIAVVAVTAGR